MNKHIHHQRPNALTKLFPTLLLAACAACIPLENRRTPTELLGQAAPPEAAERTIVIGPQTRHVNVVGGETIRFVSGDKAFGWSFQGPAISFELNRVAPPGVLDRPVMVYIDPDPRYFDGDDGDGPGR